MKILQSAAATVILVIVAPASALAGNWPDVVTGTWAVIANNSTQITLTVTHQGVGGQCKAINGTVVDPKTGANDTFHGFYCPGSGRIAFLRHIGKTESVYQSWSGNLSHTETTEFAGGTFFDIVNDRGEYQWFGTQNNG